MATIFDAASGEAGAALALAATLLRALPPAQCADGVALADRCEALIGPAVPPRLQQRAWVQLSALWGNRQKQRGHDAALRALELARALRADGTGAGHGDSFNLCFALARLVCTASVVGDAETATAALAELRTLEDPAWPPHRSIWGVEAQAHVGHTSGDAVAKLDLVRRLLAMTRGRGESGSINLANLIDSELAAGDAAAAARSGRALVAALQGRLPEAAQQAGFADRTYAARGNRRDANQAAAVDRARAIAQAGLAGAACERLRALGATLRDDEIAALAFTAKV